MNWWWVLFSVGIWIMAGIICYVDYRYGNRDWF